MPAEVLPRRNPSRLATKLVSAYVNSCNPDRGSLRSPDTAGGLPRPPARYPEELAHRARLVNDRSLALDIL